MGYNSNTPLQIQVLCAEQSRINIALLEKSLCSPSIITYHEATAKELLKQQAVPVIIFILHPFLIAEKIHATLKVNIKGVAFHTSFIGEKQYLDISFNTDSTYIHENLSIQELEYDEDADNENGGWFTHLHISGVVRNEFPDWPQSNETTETESVIKNYSVRCPILLSF